MKPPRVLVVDDDAALRAALRRALAAEGYAVDLADSGLAALAATDGEPFDVLVLDVAMPGVDGLAVARRLRSYGDRTPILMLTARDGVDDRVAGLDAGADDYLVKPFALEELYARLRALTRRGPWHPEAGAPSILAFADLTMDLARVRVTRADREVELTRTEFTLLETFLRAPGRVLGREYLLEAVWGLTPQTSSNSPEVYVGYLRRKLEAAGEPRLIQTVRGFGYVLRAGNGS